MLSDCGPNTLCDCGANAIVLDARDAAHGLTKCVEQATAFA